MLVTELRAELDSAVLNGYIRTSRQGDLTLYCYTDQCVYNCMWNDVTKLARGLILSDENAIIARPFEKFFNAGELGIAIPDLPFETYEKLDGSLIECRGRSHDHHQTRTRRERIGWYHQGCCRQFGRQPGKLLLMVDGQCRRRSGLSPHRLGCRGDRAAAKDRDSRPRPEIQRLPRPRIRLCAASERRQYQQSGSGTRRTREIGPINQVMP